MSHTEMRFTGRIAGVGTSSGTRLVVGMWQQSPFGVFADVMVEESDGTRTLLAPSEEVAELISGTYSFDRVDILPVTARGRARVLYVRSPRLSLDLTIGRVSPLGVLLRLIPSPIARSWRWAALVDPMARILVPGAQTAGSAGGGRREYYGVNDARSVTDLAGSFDGADLGSLAPLSPPVRFGFAQTPAAPTMVDVTTTIR
jgi:hypothetical protein